jgi:hypothetical protein
MAPGYVRANTSKGGIAVCQLTVTDGTTTKSQNIKIENIDKEAGEEAYATWALANKSKAASVKSLEASEVTMSEMVIEDNTRVPVSPRGHREMMLFNIEGGVWPDIDIDEVSTRYIEFKASVPKGKIFNISEVSLDICGFGGNNACYDVYLSTNDDFSEPELLTEGIKIPKDKCTTVTKQLLKRVPQGRNVYIRIYPWMRVSEKVRGKSLGISDLKIKGILTDAPVAPTQKNSRSAARKPASKTGNSTKAPATKTAPKPASKGAAVKKPVTTVKKK